MYGDRLRCGECGQFRSHLDAPGDTVPGLIAASHGVERNREPFTLACPNCEAATKGYLGP